MTLTDLTLQTDAQGRPKRNVGQEAAIAAAVGGTALIPEKASDRGMDWNDAMKARGMDAIRAELAARLAHAAKEKIAKRIGELRSCRNAARERVHEEVER